MSATQVYTQVIFLTWNGQATKGYHCYDRNSDESIIPPQVGDVS